MLKYQRVWQSQDEQKETKGTTGTYEKLPEPKTMNSIQIVHGARLSPPGIP